MNQFSDYQAIDASTPLKKEKEGTATRALFWGVSAALLMTLAVYFVYSGYYGVQTPLRALFTAQEATEVRIEYYLDDERAADLKPDTAEWLAFHDALMEEAGYDAAALRANPLAKVTFVAYDVEEEAEDDETVIEGEDIEEEMRKRGSGNFNRQKRPTYGLSCYTEYTEVGDFSTATCSPTRKISDPIRTGCSALSFGTENYGVEADFDENSCSSSSMNVKVSARCCQPTPMTDYVSSTYDIDYRESDDSGNCVSVGCKSGEVLVGCSGYNTDNSLMGGTKMADDECTAQAATKGSMKMVAMCAEQADSASYTLSCEAVNADSASAPVRGGTYLSTVQCPVNTVMFDCNSFTADHIDECMSPSNDAFLAGEYYYREKKRSKYQCQAVGDSDDVRAQAICCGFN